MLTFTDPNLAAQWGMEFFASISPVLTDEELTALRCYKQSEYLLINDALRALEEGDFPPIPLPDAWTKIYLIDEAISKSPLPPLVLYRGQWLPPEKVARFENGTLIGETIWNKGFCSTSLLFEEAQEYFLQFPQESVILKTETQWGMKGIYLDVEEIEELNQYEVLLPRSLGWRVLHTEHDAEDRRVVTAELVMRG